MANTNPNSCIHNIGLNEENSLSNLLERISPEIESETDLIEHSKYCNDVDFKNVLLHNTKSKISMLSLNYQSINAKFDKLKLFLDDVSIEHLISVICQESWGHEKMEMSYFSLPNYSMVFEKRRLSTHGGLILYVHDDFEYRSLRMARETKLFESVFVKIWRK